MKKIITIALIFCIYFLTGCMGKSAYDLAVENGFDGTVEDYLESLKGENSPYIGIEDIFNYLVEKGDYDNDEYSIFLKDYLNGYISDSINEEVLINNNLKSVVNITVSFPNLIGTLSYFAGAGVVYKISDNETFIITNHHVVSSSSNNLQISSDIKVSLYGNDKQYKASYIGSMISYDVAVIKIEKVDVKEVKVSNARTYVADTIYAIGNPLGYGISVTKGVVSVESEYINTTTIDSLRVLRIDAPINGGNSGGGLFNKYGELIGIIDAKVVAEDVEGMCYALPISNVELIAKHIIKTNSSVDKVVLGIYTTIENSYAVYDEDDLKFYIKDKVIVDSVITNSSAYKAGLESGQELISVIIKEKEYKIERNFTLTDLLFDVYKDEMIVIKVYQNGIIKNLEVIL